MERRVFLGSVAAGGARAGHSRAAGTESPVRFGLIGWGCSGGVVL